MLESFVICMYGVTNVGLEHLANTDGEWAATDLEHISITLMFFGGGLVRDHFTLIFGRSQLTPNCSSE